MILNFDGRKYCIFEDCRKRLELGRLLVCVKHGDIWPQDDLSKNNGVRRTNEDGD